MSQYNPQLEADFDKVDELLNEEKVQEAKALLLSILERDDTFGKAHNHLGWIYHRKEDDFENAEKHYKLAMQYSPDYGAGYINYVYLLSAQKRFDELEKQLQLSETIPDVSRISLLKEWAYLYEDTLRFDQSIAKFKEWALQEYNSETIDKIAEDVKRCRLKKQIQEE